MRRFRCVRGVVVVGLASVLVGVLLARVSAVAARAPCRPAGFVTNAGSASVSTIDVKIRTKKPTDIAVGSFPLGLAVTPDGKTVVVANNGSGTVSTIDVKTRTKHPRLNWSSSRTSTNVADSAPGSPGKSPSSCRSTTGCRSTRATNSASTSPLWPNPYKPPLCRHLASSLARFSLS
jgi:hypothetical protein